jgi:MFS family permease
VYGCLLIILLVIGFISSILNIPTKSLIQNLVPDKLRGRIFGFLNTVNQGLVPVSMISIGVLLDVVPAYLLFVGAGVFWLLNILVGFSKTDLEELNSSSEEQEAVSQ